MTAPHVVVVGAGLVGLTSALSLTKAGFQVTVVDRQQHVCNETSFANASILMRSYSRPKTMTIWQMFTWLTTKTEPVHISLKALFDPAMIEFGLRFFLAGPQTKKQVLLTTAVNDQLAESSVDEINSTRQELALTTPALSKGLLMYFKDKVKLDAMLDEGREVFPDPAVAEKRFRAVTPGECLELEPLLKDQGSLAGGVLWPLDMTMDPHGFATELASHLNKQGTEFVLGESVDSFTKRHSIDGPVTDLQLASGKMISGVDAVVVAAGVESGKLLAHLGGESGEMVPTPLYGMRGHSVTLDVSHLKGAGENEHVITRSLCDGDSMAFYSPLGGDGPRLLRCAAFGDFDGWDYGPKAIRPWRMKMVEEALLKLLGKRASDTNLAAEAKQALASPPLNVSGLGDSMCPDNDRYTRWCGLRPMSPDGLPVVGKAGEVKGCPVFVNAGHGALGWTLSSGCGVLLADAVRGEVQPAARRGRGHSEGAAARAAGDGFRVSKTLQSLAPHLDPGRFRWGRVLRRALKMRL